MPIHDLGYRAWEGERCNQLTRWLVITETGLRLAWKSRLLRRFLLLAWLPAVYMGVAFFFFEQSIGRPEMRYAAMRFFRDMAGGQGRLLFESAMLATPAEARHTIWGWLLLIFFRHPQGVLMALVVGLVAPPLISQDVRSRALLLYFSRPITYVEYVLGKFLVICAFVGMITTAPALTLYVFGVMLSPDLTVIGHTWDFLIRILAASAVLMIPTAALALAFSSLTTRSYFATFAWFATWGIGIITYYSMQGALQSDFDERWALVSLFHTLGKVQTWIFDLTVDWRDVWPYLSLLVVISVVSLAIVFRRVSSCLRA